MNESGIYALLAFGWAIILIFFVVGILFYILGSLGLYKLAQNAGIENPWLAWIPIGNLYILAKLVRTVKIGTFEIPRIEITLPVGAIAVAILGGIPVLGTLITLAYFVLLMFVLYKLYNIYRPQQATLYLILSIISLWPVLLFIMRNDRPLNY